MNFIVGRKPVLEAINSGEELEQIYILYGQKGGIINAIRVAAKKKNIKCNEIPAAKFNSYTKHPNAQGVIALKSDHKYFQLEEIIHSSKKSEKPLLLLLDSIQDTHNLGAILRSAECCGVDGVIITKHNSAPINQTVAKTSAGATEHVKVCQVNNLVQAIKDLKKKDFGLSALH